MQYLYLFIIILAVHASGIITGAFMNSGAVRCGILICRPVTGLYTKNPLPNGYVHIATIPAGASNISITELKNSMNFLVLKSGNQKYIINGDFSVSLSGIYEASGALFDYRRIDGLINGSHHINRKIDGVTEWITSTGPITEPIHLMVLAQESNPGIKYEYLLPINSVSSSSEEMSNSYEYTSGETEQPITTLSTSDQIGKHTLKSGAPAIVHANMTMPIKRKRKFLWKVVGFSACSKSCGGGIQSPIIRCVREAPTRIFAAKRCSHLIKPILNENLMRCNTQPCPAYWKIDEWNDCNCGKHNEQIFQSRVIKCVQELGTGMVIQVNIGACLEDEPTFRQKCDCPKIKKHKHNHHELNSIKNRINGIGNGGSGGIAGDIDNTGGGGNGATKPSVSLIGNSSISKRAHTADNKKNGIWLVSEWNQQCSTDCGDGIQYRSIFCDRSAPTIERCDLRFTPDTTRQCTVTNKCNVGDWFIGPWSQCSGDCFNLTKSRSVFCIKDEEIVSESECNIGSEKPDILQSCGLDEVPDCRPRWHYSEWTECTKKCGGGTQRRTVKCFQPNIEEKQMKDSKNCKYVERPQAYRNCNTFNCESTTQSQPIDPRVDLIQNDIEPVCKDEFPNCNLVVEAHLCNYSYYEAHCCETCRKRS